MWFGGRLFLENERYQVRDRHVTGETQNKVWLYTVDVATEVDSGRAILQLVRWRARLGEGRPPQKLWKRFRNYNIRSTEQWESASRAIDACIHGASLAPDPDFLRLATPATEARTEQDQLDDVTAELQRVKEADQLHRAEKRRAEQRLREMKRHVGTYRRALAEFKSLVENTDTKETTVHTFIERTRPFWMFGLEYTDFESKVRFPPRSQKFEFDLMLKRIDGFYDLVELKGPNDSLFDRRTRRRSKLNVALAGALGQVFTYLNECDRQGAMRLFKPKAIIVIGNRKTDDPRQRRLVTSHLSRVEILTYSELLNHGTTLLRHLEAWKGT